MSKPPSDATTIRNLRRDLREENKVSRLHAQRATEFGRRAGVAEAEVLEWKRRFDALLARTPETKEQPR